jgi:lysophospholipase L1-like esterase
MLDRVSSRSLHRGGHAAKLALMLASLGLMGVVGEAVSHFLWEAKMETLRRAEREQRARPPGKWDHLPKLKGLSDLARPGARGTMAGALFENNRYGFRGPERPHDKPQGSFRVAAIGDSVTMGPGVLYEDTYAARIERELNRTRSDYQYEVVNVGLSGLNTAAVVERFEDIALPFDPDLVIYGYTLNDIEGPLYRRSVQKTQERLAKYYASPLRLWRLLGPKWMSLRDLLLSPAGSYYYELDDNYFDNPEAWRAVLDGMDRLTQIARERDVCVLLLLYTTLETLHFLHPYHACYDTVAVAAEDRGFHVARSFDYFRGMDGPSLWITPFDSHPNERGHELLAQAALAGLEALPPVCWQRRDRPARTPSERGLEGALAR